MNLIEYILVFFFMILGFVCILIGIRMTVEDARDWGLLAVDTLLGCIVILSGATILIIGFIAITCSIYHGGILS